MATETVSTLRQTVSTQTCELFDVLTLLQAAGALNQQIEDAPHVHVDPNGITDPTRAWTRCCAWQRRSCRTRCGPSAPRTESLAMNRTEARELWARVAAGDLAREQHDPVDLWAWIQQIARQVLEADDEPDARRRQGQLVKAIELAGREDEHAELKQLVSDFCMFENLIEPDETQAAKVEHLRQVALQCGLLRGVYRDDPKKGRDFIRDLLPR